ncbi:hypothetical protein FQZ97_912890 [compost metagenome]
MAEHDTETAEAKAFSSNGIVSGFQNQYLRPNKAGVRNPSNQCHGDIKALKTRPQNSDDRQHQYQKWERQNDIDQAHEDRINDATKKTGNRADDRSNGEREYDTEDCDLKIDTCTPDNARENIPPEIISPERVQP